MAEALFYKRMHGLKQTIYKWNQYNINTTYTYWWHRYNVVNSTTYNWNKYNAVSTTVYQWNKWSTESAAGYDTSTNGSINYSFTSYNDPPKVTMRVYTSMYDPWPVIENGTPYLRFADASGSNYSITPNDTFSYKGWTTHLNGFYEPSPSPAHWLSTDMTIMSKTGSATGSQSTGKWTMPVYYLTRYTAKMVQSKGSTSYGVVTSTSSSAYPNGGASGSYWYDGRTTTTQWSKGSTSYGTVSSTSSSAYPSNGKSGSYWYVSAGSTTSSSKGSTNYGYVTSSSRYTYPDDGEYNGYWYEYDYSPTSSQSQGSYVGEKFSTNRNAYPENGVSGSYWYVFAGEA